MTEKSFHLLFLLIHSPSLRESNLRKIVVEERLYDEGFLIEGIVIPPHSLQHKGNRGEMQQWPLQKEKEESVWKEHDHTKNIEIHSLQTEYDQYCQQKSITETS